MTMDPASETRKLTSQEQLWRGDFGNEYTDRNAINDAKLAALTSHWARVLRCTMGGPPQSILEVGANIGLNLRAIRRLTSAEFFAVEPNNKAREMLANDGVVPEKNILDGLCTDIRLPANSVDMAFTSGVLIHISPDHLLASCQEIYRVARRYIVCVEYFSDRAEEIKYRGHSDALFKRDFGGFYLDTFSDLRVIDYGFAWKRLTGLDNLTWWVFEKQRV
jgi:pseudaminic acid biosynthesis-associated methylase